MAVRAEAGPLSTGQLYSVAGSRDERVEVVPHLLQAREKLVSLGHDVLDAGAYDDQHGHNAQLLIDPALSPEETSALVQETGLHLHRQGPDASRLH